LMRGLFEGKAKSWKAEAILDLQYSDMDWANKNSPDERST